MPLTRFVADAFGVVTICLVTLFVLLGLFCILYSAYFRSRIQTQGFSHLSYFNGPWKIRITFILLTIWWGFGEVYRLSLLRREGPLDALNLKWQENICKIYIISNLGFAEPGLLLTLVFLLRASLQKRELGTLSQKWNRKTAGFVFLFCFPIFVLQLIVILTGPKFNNGSSYNQKMPHYFTSVSWTREKMCLCTYPLLGTILLGLFVTLLTAYFLWLGRKMVSSVINKRLKRRVCLLFISISSLLPFRVLMLGLSVLFRPDHVLFEALVFLALLALLYCAALGIFMLVYHPIADSLALRGLCDMEARGRTLDEFNDTASLIANQNFLEASTATNSVGRNSDASKRGSISFRTMVRDEAPAEVFEELSLFSPGPHHLVSPPGSPPLPGQPMLPLTQISELLRIERERL